ncbi:MAG: hypothetical protein ACRETD_10365, partial [Steroidobacteraceae bacterium]
MDQPARFRGIGFGPRLRTQEKSRDAFLLRTQDKAARRDQIEDSGIARNLDDHRAQRSAGQCIRPSLEGIGGIGRAHQDHAIGEQAQLGQAGGHNFPVLKTGEILTDPEKPPVTAYPFRQTQHKSRGTRIARKHFMQGPLQQSAAQYRIGCGVA